MPGREQDVLEAIAVEFEGETLSYRVMIQRIFETLGQHPRFLRLPFLASLPGAIGAVAARMEQDLAFDGGEFWPLAEWSYLLAGATPVSSWNGFLTGTQQYNSPEMVAQITAWAELYKNGCANTNALTDANNQAEFEHGKAAMIIEGSWDTPIFQPFLGSNLGVFEPPYSATGKQMIVELAGQGFGIPKSSPNKTLAEQFLASILTSSGQTALVKTGQIPIYTGYPMPAISQELLQTAANKSYQVYPMFDNYMQQSVATVANKVLDQAFVGQITPQAALQQIEAALQDLPSAQRSATYPL